MQLSTIILAESILFLVSHISKLTILKKIAHIGGEEPDVVAYALYPSPEEV